MNFPVKTASLIVLLSALVCRLTAAGEAAPAPELQPRVSACSQAVQAIKHYHNGATTIIHYADDSLCALTQADAEIAPTFAAAPARLWSVGRDGVWLYAAEENCFRRYAPNAEGTWGKVAEHPNPWPDTPTDVLCAPSGPPVILVSLQPGDKQRRPYVEAMDPRSGHKSTFLITSHYSRQPGFAYVMADSEITGLRCTPSLTHWSWESQNNLVTAVFLSDRGSRMWTPPQQTVALPARMRANGSIIHRRDHQSMTRYNWDNGGYEYGERRKAPKALAIPDDRSLAVWLLDEHGTLTLAGRGHPRQAVAQLQGLPEFCIEHLEQHWDQAHVDIHAGWLSFAGPDQRFYRYELTAARDQASFTPEDYLALIREMDAFQEPNVQWEYEPLWPAAQAQVRITSQHPEPQLEGTHLTWTTSSEDPVATFELRLAGLREERKMHIIVLKPGPYQEMIPPLSFRDMPEGGVYYPLPVEMDALYAIGRSPYKLLLGNSNRRLLVWDTRECKVVNDLTLERPANEIDVGTRFYALREDQNGSSTVTVYDAADPDWCGTWQADQPVKRLSMVAGDSPELIACYHIKDNRQQFDRVRFDETGTGEVLAGGTGILNDPNSCYIAADGNAIFMSTEMDNNSHHITFVWNGSNYDEISGHGGPGLQNMNIAMRTDLGLSAEGDIDGSGFASWSAKYEQTASVLGLHIAWRPRNTQLNRELGIYFQMKSEAWDVYDIRTGSQIASISRRLSEKHLHGLDFDSGVVYELRGRGMISHPVTLTMPQSPAPVIINQPPQAYAIGEALRFHAIVEGGQAVEWQSFGELEQHGTVSVNNATLEWTPHEQVPAKLATTLQLTSAGQPLEVAFDMSRRLTSLADLDHEIPEDGIALPGGVRIAGSCAHRGVFAVCHGNEIWTLDLVSRQRVAHTTLPADIRSILADEGKLYVAMSDTLLVLDARDLSEQRRVLLTCRNVRVMDLNPTTKTLYLVGEVKEEGRKAQTILYRVDADARAAQALEDIPASNVEALAGNGALVYFNDQLYTGERRVRDPYSGYSYMTSTYESLTYLARIDTAKGELVGEITDKVPKGVYQMEMTPDLRGLVLLGSASSVGSSDGRFRLPVYAGNESGDVLYHFELDARASTIAFHPGLNLALIGNGRRVTVADAKDGHVILDDLLQAESISTINIVAVDPYGREVLIQAHHPHLGEILLHRTLVATDEELARGRERHAAELRDQNTRVAQSAGSSGSVLDGFRFHGEAPLPQGSLPWWYEPDTADDLSTVQVARQMQNAVVLLKHDEATATGFFISPDGLVLSCAHALPSTGPTNVVRLLDGNLELDLGAATVLAVDAARDLALLRVDPGEAVGYLPIVHQLPPETGQRIYVMGNPGMGTEVLQMSLTTGVLSNVSRVLDGHTYLQTNAAVNPGVSGAPMCTQAGTVIGLIVAKGMTGEGLSFAVPARDIIDFLRRCRY